MDRPTVRIVQSPESGSDGAVARWMRALVVAQPRRATPGSARPLDRHSGRMGPPERRSVPRSSSRGCWAGAHRAHHASVVEAAGRIWAYAAPKPVPSRRLQRRRCDCRRAREAAPVCPCPENRKRCSLTRPRRRAPRPTVRILRNRAAALSQNIDVEVRNADLVGINEQKRRPGRPRVSVWVIRRPPMCRARRVTARRSLPSALFGGYSRSPPAGSA